jgi:hypothetical protein
MNRFAQVLRFVDTTFIFVLIPSFGADLWQRNHVNLNVVQIGPRLQVRVATRLRSRHGGVLP